MVVKPKIIECNFGFHQESFTIVPKMILIIENKRISEDDIVAANIDYENTNPYSLNNIANFFNREHANLIRESIIDNSKELSSKGYSTMNMNFAYHYLIDKKGNIYEGRHKSIPAYNLDIFTIKNGEYSIMSSAENIFKNFIIIMTEENTDEKTLSSAAHNSLSELVKYILKTDNTIKEYFTYNEISNFELNITDSQLDSNLKYFNPGLCFPTNLLRGSITGGFFPEKQVTEFKQTIYSYASRSLIYNQNNPMTGNDIIQLQYYLYKLGYFSSFDKVTGAYDYDSAKAIADYQFAKGIQPEFNYGQADKNTMKKLSVDNDTEYYERFKEKSSENYFFTQSNYTPEFFRILKYEEGKNIMMGEDVKYLQGLLKIRITDLQEITGFYDKQTSENVKLFQSLIKVSTDDRKINPDGLCSPYLIEALKKATSLKSLDTDLVFNKYSDYSGLSYPIALLQTALNNLLKNNSSQQKVTGTVTTELYNTIYNLNSDINNLVLMGIDKLERNGQPIDWSSDDNKHTCFIEEYDYLIRNYLKL